MAAAVIQRRTWRFVAKKLVEFDFDGVESALYAIHRLAREEKTFPRDSWHVAGAVLRQLYPRSPRLTASQVREKLAARKSV